MTIISFKSLRYLIFFMPNWCALRAWWKISRLARTWKIKTYWENNHILRVIEDFRGYTQSLAKPLTTRAC